MKQFILTAGPFSDEAIEYVARGWGWVPGAISAEDFVREHAQLKFAAQLSEPKIQAMRSQIELEALSAQRQVETQVAQEVATMTTLEVREIEE